MKSLFLIAISASSIAAVAEPVDISARECAAGADAEESPAGCEWSALRVGNEIAGEDSWYGFNYSMFVVQDVVMECGAKPLNNSRLKMIHTRDDFLLDAADRDYLDDALGDRITWFSAGAHCGMFYTPEFKQEVLERLNCNSKP